MWALAASTAFLSQACMACTMAEPTRAACTRRSLAQPIAGPPTTLSGLLLVCVQGARPLAHTSGATNFLDYFFEGTFFFETRGASKRDAMSANP
jgi:hypothetical protein